MTPFRLIFRSLTHYARNHLLVALGVAVSTAVLTGALVIGDSVRYSLEKNVDLRLGRTTHMVDGGERFFTTSLARSMEGALGVPCLPILKTGAVAVVDGGRIRENEIQVIGAGKEFWELAPSAPPFSPPAENQAVISRNLSEKLQLEAGDMFLLRIKKSSVIPANAPFVSDEETSVSFRVRIAAIADDQELGRFNLRHSQTAPLNVFLDLTRLNRLLEMEQKANRIMVAAGRQYTAEDLREALEDAWQPIDANLKINHVRKTNELELVSERVFIEPAISEAIRNINEDKRLILTYFVNSIRHGEKATPYSFVTAAGEGSPDGDAVIINDWLANDLQISESDSLWMIYFKVGPLRQLQEDSVALVVEDVVGMDSPYGDRGLMPYLPGLSDAGQCREWEAGIPIDLERIRDKDEDYWTRYQGTPKAFISDELAQKIWKNRFGNYTAIRFPAGKVDSAAIVSTFRSSVTPAQLGVHLREIREEGTRAARSGVDFGQLFLGLSFFVLVSSLLLTAMLFLLGFESRMSQAGTYSALGFSRATIRKLFLWEGMFISLAGSLAGILLAVGYSKIIFLLLNRLWYDIVRTSILEIKLLPLTLVIGFLVSLLLGLAVMFFSLRKRLKERVTSIQRSVAAAGKAWMRQLALISGLISGMAALVILVMTNLSGGSGTAGYFAAGGLLLLSLLLIIYSFLSRQPQASLWIRHFYQLSIRNIRGNFSRSFTIIVLFSLGSFIIVSTGANRKDLRSGAGDRSGGTGGYGYFATSTIPLLQNLNAPEVKQEYSLDQNFSFVQFRRHEGDDASCLNLNRVTNPVIIATNPLQMENRFTFVTRSDELDPGHPWNSLLEPLPGGLIPAIADQTVIQWGLGMAVGDTLLYRNSRGDTLRLKLIGGLAPSVFQGHVLISEEQFLDNFPSSSGSSVFLVNAPAMSDSTAMAQLQRSFRDYGWNMTPAAERLAEFYSVENTYLSIFLMLGVLSLVLGTLGLGIVIARTLMERRSELGILQATGFSRTQVFRIIFIEYLILLSAGILAGYLTAVVATLPSLLSSATDVSVINLLKILLFLLINSLFWIALFTWLTSRGKLVQSLRYE